MWLSADRNATSARGVHDRGFPCVGHYRRFPRKLTCAKPGSQKPVTRFGLPSGRRCPGLGIESSHWCISVKIPGKRLLLCPGEFAESWSRVRRGLSGTESATEKDVASIAFALRQEIGDDPRFQRRERRTVAGMLIACYHASGCRASYRKRAPALEWRSSRGAGAGPPAACTGHRRTHACAASPTLPVRAEGFGNRRFRGRWTNRPAPMRHDGRSWQPWKSRSLPAIHPGSGPQPLQPDQGALLLPAWSAVLLAPFLAGVSIQLGDALSPITPYRRATAYAVQAHRSLHRGARLAGQHGWPVRR